jgi:hypothetical protein
MNLNDGASQSHIIANSKFALRLLWTGQVRHKFLYFVASIALWLKRRATPLCAFKSRFSGFLVNSFW